MVLPYCFLGLVAVGFDSAAAKYGLVFHIFSIFKYSIFSFVDVYLGLALQFFIQSDQIQIGMASIWQHIHGFCFETCIFAQCGRCAGSFQSRGAWIPGLGATTGECILAAVHSKFALVAISRWCGIAGTCIFNVPISESNSTCSLPLVRRCTVAYF